MEDPAANPTGGPVAAFLNHLLRGNPWALERLHQFTGKTILFKAMPLRAVLTIQDNGEVAQASPEAAPDVTIQATIPLLLRIFSMNKPDLSIAEISGDSVLVEEIVYLSRYLTWDVEEDLSQVFGDSLAHRMATSGKAALSWPGTALLSLAGALTEYWSEERPLLARPEDVRRFMREVELLRLETETLTAKVERLEKA